MMSILAFAVPLHMLQVYDRVIPSGHEETLWVITSAVVFAMIIQSILESIRSRLLFSLSISFEQQVQKQVYELTVIDASMRKQTNAVNLWTLTQSAKTFISGPWMGALLDLPWVPLYLIVIYLFHPVMGFAATIGSLLMVLIAFVNYKTTQNTAETSISLNAAARDYLENSKFNAEAILGLGMLPATQKAWSQKVNEVNKGLMHSIIMSAAATSFSKFFRMFIQVAMLSIGAYLVLKNEMSSGAIIANSIMLSRALAPIELISSGWKNLQEAMFGLNKLLSLPPSSQIKKTREKTTHTAPKGALSVENLYYQVDTPPRTLLKGINFQLNKGDVLAVVGPSGSGKSSLVRVMLGIWDTSNGSSKYDGVDVKVFGSDFFSKHIGYLPQQVQLFPGTVSENIARLGTPDDEKVMQAAALAGCHELIMQLPDGYNTKITANGNNLSLGQQQRIGLARAFYGNPTFLFLDEPNSNLDSEGDAALINAISSCSKNGTTVVMVAHRTSVLSCCSTMLVLKNGQQIMFGSKEDVLKQIASESKANS